MKKIYILLGAIFTSGLTLAQTTAPTYNFSQEAGKHTPGAITTVPNRSVLDQDRANYFTENFDSGFGAFTADIQTGPAGFALTNSGHVNSAGNTFQIPPLATATPTQWVVLDSDNDNNSYTNPEAATLTSTKLDMTAAAGGFVALEFDQFFAEWDQQFATNAGSEDHCYIAVSNDSTNWTEVEINEGAGREARPNPEYISWDITDVVNANPDSVWIRFRWEGAWNYGWQLDNVQINDISQRDMAFVRGWRNYSADNGLTYSMVPQAHAQELVIGAIVRNVGHEDLTGCTFNYEIFDPSMTSVANGTATTTFDLTNMQQDTILHATGYTPTTLGTYTVRWTPTSNEGDDNQDNDTLVDNHFELTEYVYAMDYDDGSATGITGWPQLTSTAYFGNLFDVQVGDYISALEVEIANNTSNTGEILLVRIDRVPDGGTAWETYYEDFNAYTLEAGDIGNTISIPIQAPNGLAVQPGDLYLVTIGQFGTTSDPLFVKQGDIGWNYIQGIDENGDLRAFFDRLAPVVRPRMNQAELGIKDEAIELFEVYPNPADDNLKVMLQLENGENTVLNVLDVSGKIIKTITVGNVNGEQNLTIEVEDLTSGVYFLELVNDNAKSIKKFVKK